MTYIPENNITATELFERVGEIISATETDCATSQKMMHETLVLACAEGLSDTRQAFGNLFSQVDFLCKRHDVSLSNIIAIQKMRRDSNGSEPIEKNELLYDCRALSLFISAVFDTDIPSSIVCRIPAINKPHSKGVHIDYRYIRCIVNSFDKQHITATIDQDSDDKLISIDYADEHLTYLQDLLREGMQLNLLDCTTDEEDNGTLKPRLIIVEPDFLVDISSIARCFTDYGHHPLAYTVNRLSPAANSQAILIGNFAGSALDDIINSGDDYDWSNTFRNNFKEKALEYCTCTDLNKKENFRTAALNQTQNIRQIVDELFREAPKGRPERHQYDRDKAILEPSFVCEQLGVQGRVDLMTTDFKLLVEQKSGSNFNIQSNRPNEYGSYQKEDHYIQLLLYYGVLRQNFHLGSNKVDIRLLYSKYPLPGGLVVVNYYQQLFLEAMKFRNQLVAYEFSIARDGFEDIIDQLSPDTLNEKHLDNRFFQQWILPQLNNVTAPLKTLSDLERTYYCRMMTFVYREQLSGKVGAQEGTGNSNADLWNLPLAEKKETGNIYTGLHIINKERSNDYNGYDTITLDVPEQGADFLPNFRNGDMVYLYSYDENDVPDVRASILYKGVLTDIHTNRITVRLNDGQQNPDTFSFSPAASETTDPTYAIEHGGSDVGSSSAIRSIHKFITSSQQCKDLLLSQREPQCDKSLRLSRSYNPNYDDILLKAKQARDYFLLIGPPGTGKTSMALRFLVEEEMECGESVLIMAYTNRAVDEICGMLCDAGLDFMRIGNEYTCDERFRTHLISNAIEDCPRLDAIRQRIVDTRIIVGTTSTIQNKSYLFYLKRFSLTIIDEASQILEPNIIGLLSGNSSRFILIGDYKQLPAVVQQKPNESHVNEPLLRSIGMNDCRDSLFERLINWEYAQGRTDFIGILRKQGRMHPDVAAFTNKMFYSREKLEIVPCPHQLETEIYPTGAVTTDSSEMADRLLHNRIIFIASKKCRQPDISDKVNTDEARIVCQLLSCIHQLYGSTFDTQKTVGVIVPYRNQIAMIRKEIERLHITELEHISIDTVERYQGSQRDIIIYSFTIQNRYQLDFLTSNCFEEDGNIIDRKLNVALTRARKQMIMTGNVNTLRNNTIFSKLIDYVKEKGGYIG